MIHGQQRRRTTRRRWLGGALGVLAGVLARQARGAPAVEAGPDAAAPTKILVLGDSMIVGGFGRLLEEKLQEDYGFATARRGKTSSGLSRPDFFDWMAEAKAKMEEHEPDAVVVMFGGNDVQGMFVEEGKWIRWHEPGWAEEYARRVEEFADICSPQGQPIFWIGMPVMRPPKFHEKIKRVNWIYRAEMALRRKSWFLDIWDLLDNGKGGFTDTISVEVPGRKSRRRVRVRAVDGIHLSPQGAEFLADHIKERVHELLVVA